MAPAGVRIDRHVLLFPRERPTSRHGAQEFTKLWRVQGVSEGKKRGQTGNLQWGKIVKGCQIAGLVDLCNERTNNSSTFIIHRIGVATQCRRKRQYLIDVGLFLCETELAQTLVLDGLQKIILEQLFHYSVLERCALDIG